MQKAATIVALAVLLGSCVNKDFYLSYEKKVDSLSVSLEEMAVKYEALDTVLIRLQYDSVKTDLDSLARIPESTLLPAVVNYKYIGKDFKTFWRGHPLTIKELRYTRSQLRDLKHDIVEYQLEPEQVATYFIQEKESVRKLKERMDYNMDFVQRNMRQYAKLRPEVHALLDSLNTAKHAN